MPFEGLLFDIELENYIEKYFKKYLKNIKYSDISDKVNILKNITKKVNLLYDIFKNEETLQLIRKQKIKNALLCISKNAKILSNLIYKKENIN